MITKKRYWENFKHVVNMLVMKQDEMIAAVEKYKIYKCVVSDSAGYDQTSDHQQDNCWHSDPESGLPYIENMIEFLDDYTRVFAIQWYPDSEKKKGGWDIRYGDSEEFVRRDHLNQKPFTEKNIYDFVKEVYDEMLPSEVYDFSSCSQEIYDKLTKRLNDIKECEEFFKENGVLYKDSSVRFRDTFVCYGIIFSITKCSGDIYMMDMEDRRALPISQLTKTCIEKLMESLVEI